MKKYPAVNKDTLSRRSFLQSTGLVVAGLASGAFAEEGARPHDARLTQLSEHLHVYKGPINVGIVRDGSRALLIDCGDGRAVEAFGRLGIDKIDQVLFTHHHRDQACGAHALAARGAKICVPEVERRYFDDVASYWNDPKERWMDYDRPPRTVALADVLAESVRVDVTLKDDDAITWGPATIRVLATPGHTEGAVSYLVEADGKRALFCGDCIYDEGQLWDIHSLQGSGGYLPEYLGFMGARKILVKSLARIKGVGPNVLVPSHGRVMTDPARAIDLLLERIETCYVAFLATDCSPVYFPTMYSGEASWHEHHMPVVPEIPKPDCLLDLPGSGKIGNVLLSRSGGALVVDCGTFRDQNTIDGVRELLKKGTISKVEGLFVTHYHSDHVDDTGEFQKAFDCPCITDRHVADVITNPSAWRLPCLWPNKVRVDRVTADGESWTWHEFKLTAYFLPGQTLYHAGLLAERDDLRLFFCGDSFSKGGILDYCVSNRNWLGRDVGYDRCVALVDKLRPTHIFMPHLPGTFCLTEEQCHFMRANLAEREKLFGQIVPWEHANFGLDKLWVRCFPYEQQAKAGESRKLDVVITNHATEPRSASCHAVLPRAWGGASTDWSEAEIPAKTEKGVPLTISIPPGAKPGRYVIAVDVRFGPWDLPQFAEMIVVVR